MDSSSVRQADRSRRGSLAAQAGKMPAMRRQINAPAWAVLGLWILAIAAGSGLRLWNLSDQVVGGDEMHGVRAAVKGQLVDILRTYQQADPCIPLAGYYHLAIDARGSLNEAVVRAPALAAGLLALLVIPWLVRSRLGDAGALLLAWLLALSPLLVLYSRLARPYMPVVLVGFVSFLAFDRWAEGEGARWGWLWALCAALAIWLHLVRYARDSAPDAAARRRRASGRRACRRRCAGAVCWLAGRWPRACSRC
jgi:predicted membrane-bound mannosyltransferase